MRRRIHYPDDSIYCGPSPASGYHYTLNGIPVSTNDLSVVSGELNVSGIEDSNINNLIKNVYRVQGYYYNIEQGIEPIGGYGTMGPLGYTRFAPTNIEFGFDYLINNFQNEYEFGLTINTGKNVISDILSKEKDGLNFFVKTVREGSESLHDMSNIDADVVSFGNCFLNSYSFNYEVNSIPSASVSFSCDNLTFTDSITGIRNPAINPDTDTRYNGILGIPTGQLYETTGSDYRVSVVRNGDLTLSFEEKKYQGKRIGLEDPSDSYSFLGQKIQDATIQSFSVSLGLNRDSVVQLGSKIVKNRDIIPPVYASVNISAICNSYNTGDYLDSLEENRIYDLSLTARKPSCDPNSRTGLLNYNFNQAILTKKDYTLNIGTNKVVNYSFQVPVFDDSRIQKGVSFSGLHNPDFNVNDVEYLQLISWNSQTNQYEIFDGDNLGISSGLDETTVSESDFYNSYTPSNGTGWETLTGIEADRTNIVNDSIYEIEIRKNTGNMVSKTLSVGESYSIQGITNLNEIDIRRADQSTSVLNFIWEWERF